MTLLSNSAAAWQSDEPVVKVAVAEGADKLCVELNDGRVQEIAFSNLTGSGKDVSVQMTETKNANVLRSETASSNAAQH
jgi:azurin